MAVDIQLEFPGVSGFSPQNMWFMRRFYLAWTEEVTILLRPVRELEEGILSHLVRELKSNDPPDCLMALPWGQNTMHKELSNKDGEKVLR